MASRPKEQSRKELLVEQLEAGRKDLKTARTPSDVVAVQQKIDQLLDQLSRELLFEATGTKK